MSSFRYQGHLDYSIVSVGIYYEYLKEYFKRYKPENILILSGAQFKQAPYQVLKQLESFIGVSHYFDRSKFVINATSGFFCIRRNSGIGMECLGTENSDHFLPPSPAAIKKLKNLYHPYNEKLFKMINRSFPWMWECCNVRHTFADPIGLFLLMSTFQLRII